MSAEAIPGVRWDPLLNWLYDLRDRHRYRGRAWRKWNAVASDVFDGMASVVAGQKVRVIETDEEKGILVEAVK